MSYYTDNREELERLAPLLHRIATGQATHEEKQAALDSPLAAQFGVAALVQRSDALTKMQAATAEIEAWNQRVKQHLIEAVDREDAD